MNYSTQTEQSIDIDDLTKGIEIMKIKKPRQPRQKKIKEVKIDIAGGVKQNDTTNQIKDIIFQEELKELEKTVEENVKNKIGELDIEKTILSHLGNYIEEPYNIIESYFQGQHLERLVRHQIESYNHFVNYQIQRTIQMFNPVTVHSDNDYIENENKYLLEILISFTNFKLYPPQIHENNGATKMMLPQEAKIRNFTYASNMTLDINLKYVIRNNENMETPKIIEKVLPKINIGKLPIMLKSSICVLTQNKHIHPKFTGECYMDCGGYFIIKGSEKTVLGQERAAENRVYCFDGKNTTKWNWFAEIKSVPDFKCISPKQIEMMIASKNNGFGHGIFINVPRIKNPIELFVLFRALGVLTDKEICQYIILNIDEPKNAELLQCLQASIIDANKFMSQEDALKHITSSVAYTPINMDKETGAKKKREFTLEVLDNDLFPHCQTLKQKLYLLGYMCKKLIQTSLGWIPPDDRDSYLNKRIELTGTLLNNLFRNYFNKLVKEMQKQIVREINNGSWRSTEDYENIVNMTNIYKIMKSTTIENGINRALATGDFSIKQSNSSKVGVAQVLNRLTYVASLSHLRRINTPLEKSGELIAPRKLHNTTWGFLCPAETPEGQSIGVVKNISYLGHITIPTNSSSLYDYVKPYIFTVDKTEPSDLYGKVKVFVNGCWLGITDTPMELYKDLKDKKYKGIINIYTSVVFDFKLLEIRVCNDGGRLTRPVLKVRDNKAIIDQSIIDRLVSKELSWNDMLTNCKINESVIEYIDPEEQNFAMIAMKCKDSYLQDNDDKFNYTHCEIHPSTIFGVLASCIPFPEHNQAPRNTYQTAMGKQAMGVYATNYDQRMDKTAYVLNYPSRPLVETRVMNFIQLNNIPSGTQIHVAIMTHTGYNQEDSVLINKGSLDRGLFLATIYHTEKDEDKNIIRDEIIRCKPDATKTKGIKFGNYDKLNTEGFIPENSLVENRDIIIAKIIPIKENRNDPTKTIKFEDQSKTFRTTEDTYIDKNYTGRNGDGYNFAKVRVRTLRKPVFGDKFSSRHGQKGTAGNIIPEEDMPFTKDGIRPDIIINPHAIPSRMTIGQLKETLLGKVLLELGLFGDGTSFGNLDVKTIAQELQNLGYESYGNELLYNGLTGEQLETNIFIGPVFYQRLKHMVNDKQHSRSIGPMVNLTRQPAEGRSRDGGFRIGEMERDVMIAHGMSKFCRERLYDVSDKYSVHVCKKCGMVASYNDGNKNRMYSNADFTIHLCKNCDNKTDFAKIEIPYAYKLMSQELQTINIVPRIITE
jgi:DNA-directed RNA polymerase II subunit RPB2